MTITPMARRMREMHRDPGGELRWCLGCNDNPIGVIAPVSPAEWIWWAKPHPIMIAKMGTAWSEDEAMHAVEAIVMAYDLEQQRGEP